MGISIFKNEKNVKTLNFQTGEIIIKSELFGSKSVWLKTSQIKIKNHNTIITKIKTIHTFV